MARGLQYPYTMAQPELKFYPGRRHLLLLALIVVAVYVLLPQLGDFRSSWQLLRRPQAFFTAAAIGLTFATYAAAAGTYCLLAFRPLLFGRTLLVQLAAMFVNRLLPAGIGALGANYLYLRHEHHRAAQAGSIVAINNLLGFLGHALLIVVTLMIVPDQALTAPIQLVSSPGKILDIFGIIAVIAVLIGCFLGRQKVAKALTDIKQQLLSYRHRPWSLVAALATSLTLTICNVLCLFCCLHALGLQLPFSAVLLVFTFGLSAGSAIPTPGGLGGFEAGLAAGFVAYHIDPAPALATALLYRLISYWLPTAAGIPAFVACQRRKLFTAAGPKLSAKY